MLFGKAVIALAVVPLAERQVVGWITAEQRVLDGEGILRRGRRRRDAAGHFGARACRRGRRRIVRAAWQQRAELEAGRRPATARKSEQTGGHAKSAHGTDTHQPTPPQTAGLTQPIHAGIRTEFPASENGRKTLRECW